MNIDLLLCILGMALVTLIPRVMPVTLLAGRELPPLLTRWLSFVPVSVLAALVAPDLLLAGGSSSPSFYLTPDTSTGTGGAGGGVHQQGLSQ